MDIYFTLVVAPFFSIIVIIIISIKGGQHLLLLLRNMRQLQYIEDSGTV